MPDYKYILPPLVGAFIGWLTNYVAIKLLFRPRKPITVLGFTIHGLIPRRRKEIAATIARAIENELLSSKDIAATLEGIEWKKEVETTVSEMIEHRFRSSGISRIPLIGLVSENLVYHVKYIITKDILRQIEKKKDDLSRRLTESVNVEDMLATRIDSLDLKKFEGLLTGIIARELRHIEWLGGMMGFLIGLFQAALMRIMG